MKPSSHFTPEQKARIVETIKRAESTTSAEIRLHIERRCKGSALDRAVKVFSMLKMEQTVERNGVLVYLAIDDRKSAIIGDININKCVSHDFWNNCHSAMSQHFAQGDFTAGICLAIEKLEDELRPFFPHRADDVNELSDDISFGK